MRREHSQGGNHCIPAERADNSMQGAEYTCCTPLGESRKCTSEVYRPASLPPHPLASLKQVNNAILQDPTWPAHTPAQPGSYWSQRSFQLFTACQRAHPQAASVPAAAARALLWGPASSSSGEWGELHAYTNSAPHSKGLD